MCNERNNGKLKDETAWVCGWCFQIGKGSTPEMGNNEKLDWIDVHYQRRIRIMRQTRLTMNERVIEVVQ